MNILPKKLEAIANDMGVALYHRFSEYEAAKLLSISEGELGMVRKLVPWTGY